MCGLFSWNLISINLLNAKDWLVGNKEDFKEHGNSSYQEQVLSYWDWDEEPYSPHPNSQLTSKPCWKGTVWLTWWLGSHCGVLLVELAGNPPLELARDNPPSQVPGETSREVSHQRLCYTTTWGSARDAAAAGCPAPPPRPADESGEESLDLLQCLSIALSWQSSVSAGKGKTKGPRSIVTQLGSSEPINCPLGALASSSLSLSLRKGAHRGSALVSEWTGCTVRGSSNRIGFA